MTMTTLDSWRIIVENEHNDIQKMLDDWENEQQAALLTERELSDKITDLVAAVEAAKFWMEGQHSTVSGDCGVCGSESPYHHGQCPKAQVDQALNRIKEE